MSETQSKYKELLKALASPEMYQNVKSFLSTLYEHLATIPSSSLKPEHQDEFIDLRSQFRNLINQTRGFCDKAIPCVQYALKQLQSNDSKIVIDCKELAVQLLSTIDPTRVLEQCELLEEKICRFIDRIKMDSYYKTNNLMSFLCIAAASAAAIASTVSLVALPFVVEIELITLSPLIATNAISSINLISQGLTKLQDEKDLKQYRLQINNAKELVYQLKLKLADVTRNHQAVKCRLNFDDIRDLQPIYENILNNMNDIHALCSKSFPD